jgi:hypothetical protein
MRGGGGRGGMVVVVCVWGGGGEMWPAVADSFSRVRPLARTQGGLWLQRWTATTGFFLSFHLWVQRVGSMGPTVGLVLFFIFMKLFAVCVIWRTTVDG